MKLGIINSAFAQAGKDTRFGLEQIKAIGFDSCDVFTDPLDIDQAEVDLIKDSCRELELPAVGLVCVAVGLIDFNPSVQRFHVERCRKYLDLAKELGCENLLLVIGEYIWNREVIPPAEQWRIGVENVRTLGLYAQELGIEIVLELEPFHQSLINTVDTMLQFIDDVNLPETVLANVDISHLHLMDIGPSEVAKLKGRIGHVHLSDCNGEVHGDLPPGRGCTPIIDYLRAIRDTGFDRTVSIELEYSPEPDRIVEWVTEAYAATDAIMRELNCRDAAPVAS